SSCLSVLFHSSFPSHYTERIQIYSFSLHDALPIWSSCPPSRSSDPAGPRSPSGKPWRCRSRRRSPAGRPRPGPASSASTSFSWRSEEHTSELQSRENLVCRLLLEKKKRQTNQPTYY